MSTDGATSRLPTWLLRVSRITVPASWDSILFCIAVIIFAVSRLVGLERFPIYFFTDEAVQTVRAADFLANGFKDSQGRIFPTYFQNGPYFNLSTSVYAQVIPYELFGYSIFVTRATSAVIALSGTAAVALVMKDIFRTRSWWLAFLFLSVTPAWFLHSRTAFETVIATSLYAWFLYFYLRYRVVAAHNLYAALIFGALAFYAYSSTQIVVVLTGLAFLISDLPFHVRNWRTGLAGLILLFILALPYVRFQVTQGHEVYLHLRTLDSYWVKPGLSFKAKVTEFWSEYKFGLSPSYWFGTSNQRDLIRHLMKGYGNILVYFAPFFAIGSTLCMARIREPRYRALLLALFISPIGGAIVAIQITRVLVLVVPAAVITAIEASFILDNAVKWNFYKPASLVVFVVLVGLNLYMLNDAISNGPTWYDDYDLGGLQFGALQVTSAIKDELRRDPSLQVLLSPTWTNGTNEVVRFLMPGEKRVQLGNIDGYLLDKLPLPPSQMFVMTPSEFDKARTSPKFTGITVERTIKYPDGRDGFYFVHLAYSSEADAIFAQERIERSKPVTDTLKTATGTLTISHSRFDVGQVSDLFDNDSFTLVRTLEANPAIFDITPDAPKPVKGIRLRLGSMQPLIRVSLESADGSAPLSFESKSTERQTDPTVDIEFGSTIIATRIHIEVTDQQASASAHVHIRDIILN